MSIKSAYNKKSLHGEHSPAQRDRIHQIIRSQIILLSATGSSTGMPSISSAC